MSTPRRTAPFWRRAEPAAEHDIARLLPAARSKGKRFETMSDADAESHRSQAALLSHRPSNVFAEFLLDCREGHYECKQTYCPRCARAFRRYLSGELLRLKGEFAGNIKISTLLLAAIPKGELANVAIAPYRQLLRQRLVRAGLGDVPVIGGIEVFYRARDKIWVLHVNLAFFGGKADAIAAFEASCAHPDFDRPVVTFDLSDAPEQLSYLLKFTTYHRPLKQIGPKRSPAKPLNPADHYELVSWMAQREFADHLFLFNARRYGASIQFRNASARKA
jgi:hypothetical protein